MGFGDNFSNEFGKKVGKGVGNMLFGKNADDRRVAYRNDSNVNVNWQNGSNVVNTQRDMTDYEAIERAKRKTIQKEQEAKFLENIISIEYDANDKDAIVKTLTSLSAYVDLWIKDSSKNAKVVKSKFDTGLAMLSAVDAGNPMIAYFTNKKLEWSNYENKKRKKQLIEGIVASIIVIIALLVLVVAAQ